MIGYCELMSSEPNQSLGPHRPLLEPILTQCFGELSIDASGELLSRLSLDDLPGGAPLFHQGDMADAMYILVGGRLEVVLENEGSRQVISEVTKGEYVGEMALISGAPRSASVFAVRDSRLVKITKTDFEELVRSFPEMALNISRLVIERLSRPKSTRKRPRKTQNIALIGLHSTIDVRALASDLKDSLSLHDDTRVLSSHVIDRELGEGSAQAETNATDIHSRLAQWLEHQGDEHDLLLYVADRDSTEWTRRCLRQADDVLLIADTTQAPDITPLERELFGDAEKKTNARQTLVLCHDRTVTLPRETRSWIDPRDVSMHRHIRPIKKAEDIDRLARWVTDRSIGVVFAGGGARAACAVGTWEVLRERGVPIDFVAGTSMGAMIGGLFALDFDRDKVVDVCRTVAFGRPSRDINFFPIVSMIGGKHMRRAIESEYHGVDIADCPIGFFCSTSNLTHLHPEYHFRGPMDTLIRASATIPGILPPVVYKGALHVDGGIFDNFPVQRMAQLGVGTLIGSDCPIDVPEAPNFVETPTNWQYLRRKWLTRKEDYKVPTVAMAVFKSTTLPGNHRRLGDLSHCDIVIDPDVSPFGFFKWTAFEGVRQAGREAAERVLDHHREWLDTIHRRL